MTELTIRINNFLRVAYQDYLQENNLTEQDLSYDAWMTLVLQQPVLGEVSLKEI